MIGTRPETIKMAPVIRELGRHRAVFDPVVVATSQHREMLDQALEDMGIVPDVDLSLMKLDQGLADFASRSLRALSDCFASLRPSAVLVQGDTTTAAMAALAGFYQHALVGHVEAGLRSFDKRDPFPEEVNRRMIGSVADLHFAPTDTARENLVREGIDPETIFVTGNTVVDAIHHRTPKGELEEPQVAAIAASGRRILLVTMHRRENLGLRLYSVCVALRELARHFPDVEIVFPMHLNPNVRRVVVEELTGVPGVNLVDPLSHHDFLGVLERCYLVLSDSGGLQEEAPSFNKPVLVLRERTERPELVEVGAGILVGTDADQIVRETSRLLSDAGEYDRMCCKRENPFGDGRAAPRIVDILARSLPRLNGGRAEAEELRGGSGVA